jgi:hypothetical protein
VADLEVRSPMTLSTYPNQLFHAADKDYVDYERATLPIDTYTAGRTLTFGDSSRMVAVNSSSATTVTVPLNSSVAFRVGTRVFIRKMGTGNVTIAGASGVTINWAGGAFTITTQYASAEIHKISTDTWVGYLH